MNASTAHPTPSWSGRILNALSIRTKLGIAFGVLLGLGVLNICVYYWGAHQRADVFRTLQLTIARQAVLVEVADRLEDQKKFIDLMAGVIGVQKDAPPDDEERQRFAQGIDTIAVRLADAVALAEDGEQAALTALHAKTEQLATSWKNFYDYQWTNPAQAVEELYARAEPLSEDLLSVELPALLQREKKHLARVNAQFVQTDRTFERIAWLSFLLSALVGGALAFVIASDLFRAISQLKEGAERIGAGQLDHRIHMPNRDELGDVAESFNQMAVRLDRRTSELHQLIDDLQTTQTRLIQAEKMASLGQLTAGIAHEIKNPLNFVTNFAGLSKELCRELEAALRAGDTDEVAVLLADLRLNTQKIEEHGQRADAIVRAMMQHARGGEGRREAIDLNALLSEYVDLAYHGKRAQVAGFNTEVRKQLDGAVGQVEVVPQEIGRVVLNLVGNAFDAVQERAGQADGQVDGQASEYLPTVVVSTRRSGDQVEIRVADNGPGIPETVRGRIFEPFYTTKPAGSGTGLGLSLSYEIVTQGHGGTLTVESEKGEGATFLVTLPAPGPATP